MAIEWQRPSGESPQPPEWFGSAPGGDDGYDPYAEWTTRHDLELLFDAAALTAREKNVKSRRRGHRARHREPFELVVGGCRPAPKVGTEPEGRDQVVDDPLPPEPESATREGAGQCVP